jgi:hypothetical protein
VKPPPSADAITIAETLDLLDARFAAVAAAAERRGFASWVGSDISLGRAPNIGEMLLRALEHLRHRTNTKDAHCRFRRALGDVLPMGPLDAPVGGWRRAAMMGRARAGRIGLRRASRPVRCVVMRPAAGAPQAERVT